MECLGAALAPGRAGSPRVTVSWPGPAVVLASNSLGLQPQVEILATFLQSDLQLRLQRGSSIHLSWCHDAAAQQMPDYHPLS